MLNKQRRVKPLFQKSVRDGQRMVRERFGVDEDVCTGDHACIRLSGCPSLSVKHTDDPLKDDPVAAIDNNCVGCGNCGEVSEAAVLCPSFYRADIIHNPTWWDRVVHGCAALSSACCSAGARLAASSSRTDGGGINQHMTGSDELSGVERPICVAILAMGGQGGGVLADWIVALAEVARLARAIDLGARRRPAHRLPRSTMSRCCRAKDGRAPILSLMPAPAMSMSSLPPN